jgi:acetolactate synthase-1/2/3 large subunit
MQPTGGELLVTALKRWGIDTLFTLTGGHLFPIYDACVKQGVQLVDTRHEQTAVFAAEGLAKLRRGVAVAAVTAGPGVTNSLSAVASARANGSPLVLLGGRAPAARWGQGSLQEMDHVPIAQGVCKRALTLGKPAEIPGQVDELVAEALSPHRGPVFMDVPLDMLVSRGRVDPGPLPEPARLEPDLQHLERVAALLSDSEAPLLVVGSDVYWSGAWSALQALVDESDLPVVLVGQGRGTVPGDHPRAVSRARSLAYKEADLVLVAGTPLDFRLRFGKLGRGQVVHLADSPEQLARHVELGAAVSGSLARTLEHLTRLAPPPTPARAAWAERLQTEEQRGRHAEQQQLQSDADPIHPARVFGELLPRLQRDSVVICDGGDFASFAGKYIDSLLPGRWLDPGPFGCLGAGLGYAIAARLHLPRSQVVLLVGDGAFGFSGMDFDTLVRLNLPLTIICGNNGAWGLEKHPMQALYGHSAAADLSPGTRYDLLAEALGGQGLLVSHPADLGPTLERAFASDRPTLVNVLLDPGVAYPRKANLA